MDRLAEEPRLGSGVKALGTGALMERRRFRILLYLMPALMDCVSGIFLYIGPVRAIILGYDPLVASSMVTARAVACCLGGWVFSRYLTTANAVRYLLAAIVGYIGAALLGLLATNLTMLYVTSALAGVFMVVFSVTFQVLIKIVDTGGNRPLSQVVGSYTFSWCVGMSFGPFITGFLMSLGKPADGVGESIGWIYSYLAAAGLISICLVSTLWVIRTSSDRMRQHLSTIEEELDVSEGRGMPDLAWIGWVTAVVGCIVLGVVRGTFPSGATQQGMEEWRSGLMMMMVAGCMGVFAYVVSLGHTWMYSGRTMLAIGGLGVAGLGLYVLPYAAGWGALEHLWQFYVGSVLVGCYSGVVYLYSGFHSLAHPEKAGRNISLNEAFLAAGMIVGPLLGGWVAKHHGFYPPFIVCIVLAALLSLFQFLAHRRYGQ